MIAHSIIISRRKHAWPSNSSNKETIILGSRNRIATIMLGRTDSYSAVGRNRVTDIKRFAEHSGLHILFFHFLPPSNSLFIMLNRWIIDTVNYIAAYLLMQYAKLNIADIF